jgi:hypothetical protein
MGNRRAILVVGMHRSGTSALARVINLLGAALPAQLYQPESNNPTGYWESAHIAGLNEWVLQSAGATWSNCLGFAPEQLTGPKLVGIMASLVDGVRQEFGDDGLFVLKDPRLCLLLDLWLPALESLRIEVSAVLTLRHPIEVAHSLIRRNGVTQKTGLALWLRYMLAAELRTRSVRRSIVSYDALLTDWRTAMTRVGHEIALAWPNDLAQVAPQVDAFLRADLRHHEASMSALEVVPDLLQCWVLETYAAMRNLEGRGPREQPLRNLDRLRVEFTGWCEAMQRVSRPVAMGSPHPDVT